MQNKWTFDGNNVYDKQSVDSALSNKVEIVYKRQSSNHTFTLVQGYMYLVCITQARSTNSFPMARCTLVHYGGPDIGIKIQDLWFNPSYPASINISGNTITISASGIGCICRIIQLH